jgi:hypothetical protein
MGSGMPVIDHAERIAIYVRHKEATRLAPLLELLCGRGKRGAPAFDAARMLPGRPPPGWVPLVPVTRKVLAFDGPARTPLVIVFFSLLYAVWPAGVFVYLFITKGDWRMLMGGIVASFVGIGSLVGCVLAMVGRLRSLHQMFARCVVVPGRVTAAVPQKDRSNQTSVSLTIEYLYAGVRHQTAISYGTWETALMGSTPELLVDTEDPGRVFIRDFYV